MAVLSDNDPLHRAPRNAVALDHVLTTRSLAIESYDVLDCHISDHRPIAVTIGVRSVQ